MMADSTIDALAHAAPAWVERSQEAASTVARRIRPVWIAAAAVVGITALGVVAAQLSADDLRSAHLIQVERKVALEQTLRAQQLDSARAAIQLADLRARAAEQLERLASAEGFLK